MKFNKILVAVMAALTIVACNTKKPDEPIVTPTNPTDTTTVEPVVEDEWPEIDAPEDGYVTIVLKIPAGTECNGIAMKGTYDGAAWSGENTYLGLENSTTDAEGCIKFQSVEGSNVYYYAIFPIDENGIQGKVCLIYTNDGSWQGQAVNWSINDEYTTADCEQGDNLIIHTGGLVYLNIGGWQSSECATPVEYNITFNVPEMCGEEVDLEICGSMNGWGGGIPLTKVTDTQYTASFMATANAEYKIRSVGSWNVEIQKYNEETGEWGGTNNLVLPEETTFVVDYSNSELYRWNVCAPVEEGTEE